MGIFNFFRSKQAPTSAALAKERLQVVIAHERTDRDGPDYLPMLRKDILDVIRKYVNISEDQVSVQLDSQDNCDVLELNITLPEDGAETAASASHSAEDTPVPTSREQPGGGMPADKHKSAARTARATGKGGKRPRRRTSNPV